MEQIQIKDRLTLRQAAMTLATETLVKVNGFGVNTAYDINNHLAIAKAIENYIQGNVELPEYANDQDKYMEMLQKSMSSFAHSQTDNAPNFKVNED